MKQSKFLFTPEKIPGKPRKTANLARQMIALLVVNEGWMTRANMARYGLTARECRAGREAAHGRIINGQKGFKLTKYATAEEIRACRNFFQTQKTAAERAIIQLDKRAHESLVRKTA